MEYQLYNPQTTYILPNGETGTVERLKQDFPLCDTIPYACKAADGVLSEMTRLSVLKDIYNVNDEDATAAIAAINAAIEHQKQNQQAESVNLSDIQEQLDALAGVTV